MLKAALAAIILCAAVASSAAPAAAPTIAIAPVKGDSGAALFEKAGCGEELAQIFITELGKLSTFRVVENIDLQALKDEMKMGDDGWIESKEKTEKGHFKGADYIFIARVTRFGSSEKEYGAPGGSALPIPHHLPFLRQLPDVHFKQSENVVQLDWRVVDATTRVAMKTGRGIGSEKGTSFDFASAHGSGFMRDSQFQSSAIGKATMKAVAAVADELRSFQPPAPSRTAAEDEAEVQLRSTSGQVLYAKDSKLIVSLGRNHGFKKGDKLGLFMVDETKDDDGTVLFTKKVLVGEVEIVDADSDRSEVNYTGTTPARKGWIVMNGAGK